jgi:hypothetical protein
MKDTMNTTSKPIAVYADSAFGGYALYDIENGIDDRALISYHDSRPHWYKVGYTMAGRAFVRVFGRRVHLDNFLRV